MKVYVTVMHRWGDPDNHTYIAGVFSSKEEADKVGKLEHEWRGNKYDHVVKEFVINDPKLLDKYKEDL